MSRYLEERSGWIAGVSLFLATLQVSLNIKIDFSHLYLKLSEILAFFKDSGHNGKPWNASHSSQTRK